MKHQQLRNYLDSRTEPVCAYLYDLAHLRRRAERLRQALPPQCQSSEKGQLGPQHRNA